MKLVRKSKIISQELETIENPKMFNVESVTVEHPKTVANSVKTDKKAKNYHLPTKLSLK